MKLQALLAFALISSNGVISGSFADPVVQLEESIESDSTNLTLPSTTTGTAIVRGCSSCPSKIVQLTTASRFLLGANEVSYEEFRKRVGDGRYRLVAVYLKKTDENKVTRIVVGN